MKIKDILTIDLSEDIKNVIDLEDISEAEIQAEIENYIVTDGLAKEYLNFASIFTSNIIETGVWISGFYGSGKSYFGKLLGYLLSNQTIAGTSARDRILQRFTGINDEALIKNSISKLNSENCHVVFLDVAKQDTSKGFSYTLFRNFLKSLDLPDNEHGVLLFHLMINDDQYNINDYINKRLGRNWNDIRPKMLEYSKAAKAIFLQNGNCESDYNNIFETIRRDIDQFSASRLKEELENYIKINKDEKIVIIFDEASEAIYQKKFSLLDLEGVSEALSTLGSKVWTIAIAQEKLDDVINNSNISKAQLTKVTDRFKTKIHLETTEVDVIIRSRLLNKKESAIKILWENYNKNSGKINDLATLTGSGLPKTDNSDTYTTYYPFFKYQFNLLQNFLFGTKTLTSTKVAARGMIITTYDILKRELQEKELFDIATNWQIVKQAEPQPPARLVNRYDNAERILKENNSVISGRELLETIHFLSEAGVHETLPNIIKSFIKDPEDFYKVQDSIIKSLNTLIEERVILFANNTYRITSDIEQRMLDEMNEFGVPGFVKKKHVITTYKSSSFIKTLARVTENNMQYDFYMKTDNDDELTSPSMKGLKIKIKSVYNISDNRINDIETLKVQYQNDKDLIYVVPDNSSFIEIDKLIDEIERITYLEEKYTNPRSEEGPIVLSFSTVKSEKEKSLKDLIEQSLQNATSIYLYNTLQLDKDNWQVTMQNQQRKVVQNIYDKRLNSQLSDEVAGKVIKEATNSKLHTYFNGSDFMFFDKDGNFIGDNLKVSEEILFKIKNAFVDGSTLEKDLEQPPTGFSFGTVISSVAALMRAGKIIAKYNGSEKFSWRDDGVSNIYSKANEFRKAAFKAIAKSLSAQQKNEIVTTLRDLKYEENIKNKIDWNTNDYDLVNAIKALAKRFCDKVEDMRKQNREFDTLFSDLESQKGVLDNFTGVVSVANYIDKAETFLNSKDTYINAILAIEEVEIFIRDNLPKIRKWKSFASGVSDELTKSARINECISALSLQFNDLYGKEVVKNFTGLQQTAQKIKDEYYELMKNAAKNMTEKYTQLEAFAGNTIKEISDLPAGLNEEAFNRATAILRYANQRIIANVVIEFDIKDKETKFTYSEMLSSIELYANKKTELEILKTGLIREKPAPYETSKPRQTNPIKILNTKLPEKSMKVSEYKLWLQQELKKIAAVPDNDEIEFTKG